MYAYQGTFTATLRQKRRERVYFASNAREVCAIVAAKLLSKKTILAEYAFLNRAFAAIYLQPKTAFTCDLSSSLYEDTRQYTRLSETRRKIAKNKIMLFKYIVRIGLYTKIHQCRKPLSTVFERIG